MAKVDASADYCYITTVGRVTGRPHTIEIWFGTEDGRTLYVLAGSGERADFVRNLRLEPRVTIRVGTKSDQLRHASARVVADKAEDALVRRLLLAKYAQGDELAEWGRTALPVAFVLEE